MNLSKLYTNQPDRFEPVAFNAGLNVVLAEIRLAENRAKDTHNLGKSILARLIDFGMLLERDAKFFLYKHADLFAEFVFFLEVELADGGYVTVRRPASEATKISLKRHAEPGQDFADLEPAAWDHADVPIKRAKEILDGLLDWRAIKPWSYRKALGYLLRSQDDYRDVFQIGGYSAKHANWKPFLAHVLGFDSALIEQHYAKEEELSDKEAAEKGIKKELGGSVEELSKIEGMLLLKKEETDKKQRLLDAFDFNPQDADQTRAVVDEIEERIAALNTERYALTKNRKRISSALEESRIQFSPDEAANLFREAGVVFEGQIKRDFRQLIAFNKAITEERRVYLEEERQEIDAQLRRLNAELTELSQSRSAKMSYLSETDSFTKYKRFSDEVVTLKADIASLERQRAFLHKLQTLRAEIRALGEQKSNLQVQIEADVERRNSDPKSLFSSIRLFFNEIIESVIGRKALLSVSPNRHGHLDFKVEILDETGNATSADHGHTYRKLLCIAFDLSVVRAHLSEQFPRFIYHDGVFESLDDRKKENLLEVIRQYAGLGLQPIITLIDCDMPIRPDNDPPVFEDEEMVLRLHDEGQDGRIFKIASW
jgi:uncharacterized protein YydD (DUF2326 family)